MLMHALTVFVFGLAGIAVATQPASPAAGLTRVSQRLTAGEAREVAVELVMAAGALEIRAGAEGLFELDCYGPDSAAAPVLEYSELRQEPAPADEELPVENGPAGRLSGLVQVVQPEPGETDVWQHRWEVRLDGELCRELEAALGTGSVQLELAGSAVEEVYVEVAVGDVVIDLTGSGPTELEAECDVGVGDIHVYVPADARVRVEAEAEAGRVMMPEEFQETGDGWESPERADDARSIELFLAASVGDIVVVVEPGKE